MADPSKIKIGDKLRLELTVTRLDLDDSRRPIEAEGQYWLSAPEVEAAEHIPAPRVFKRGDWVCWKDGPIKRMVIADGHDSLWVTSDDPAQNVVWLKQDCDPTEAPE